MANFMEVFIAASAKLGDIMKMLSIQLSADTNQDGTIDGKEQKGALMRMLPTALHAAGIHVQDNPKLATVEGQEAFVEWLITGFEEFGIFDKPQA